MGLMKSVTAQGAAVAGAHAIQQTDLLRALLKEQRKTNALLERLVAVQEKRRT